MHGRKKDNKAKTEAETVALQLKCDTYRELVKVLFEKRKAKDYSEETFLLTEKMLRNNPDFYTLWNFRREILIFHNPELLNTKKLSINGVSDVRDKELTLSSDGIQKNPKSC
jgi:geranylgeranyl transferase type-2 subunit alpha